ncbi:MAG: GyrI-like domain-containing protein [Bacteroidales bacterium]
MKTLIIIIILIVAGLLAVYSWLGGFKKVQFSIQEAGGEVLVYESHIGEYKNVGKVIDKMYYSLLNEEKVECFRGFGIYYDNPQKVEKEKLRSDVGNILENPTPEVLAQLSPNYNIRTLKKQQYLVAEFPYRNQMSIIIGIMRVYPALNRCIRENNFSEEGFVMEIYDVPGKKIIYRKEI